MNIPATLDMEQMATQSLRYLENSIDPTNDGYVYFDNSFLPPARRHHLIWGHGDLIGRFLQAFAFVRAIRGENTLLEKEMFIREALFRSFQEDGLCQIPIEKEPQHRRLIIMWSQSRVLLGLVTMLMETGDEQIARRIDRMIAGLKKVSTQDGDCRYYPKNTLINGQWSDEYFAGDLPGGVLIGPLVKFYKLTGRAEVIEFAEQLARAVFRGKGVLSKMFDPERAAFGGHFHSHAAMLVGLIELGRVTNNAKYIEWSKRCFDWIRCEENINRGSSFGWFPETNYGPCYGCRETDHRTQSETCATADMIEVALALAKCGHAGMWDEAERYFRNYIVEAQITNLNANYRKWLNELVPATDDALRVAQQLMGGFAAAFRPNDLIHDVPAKGRNYVVHMMGCCPPAGVNAIFYIWNNAVSVRGSEVTVNFALNRRSPWVDVSSWLPHRGEIEITIRKQCRLRVRVPQSRETVAVTLNGQRVPAEWENDYVTVRSVTPGDHVVVTYPVNCTETQENVGGTGEDAGFTESQPRYTVKWRGNTVISLKPEGVYLPILQRQHLDTDECAFQEIPDRSARLTEPRLDF